MARDIKKDYGIQVLRLFKLHDIMLWIGGYKTIARILASTQNLCVYMWGNFISFKGMKGGYDNSKVVPTCFPDDDVRRNFNIEKENMAYNVGIFDMT